MPCKDVSLEPCRITSDLPSPQVETGCDTGFIFGKGNVESDPDLNGMTKTLSFDRLAVAFNLETTRQRARSPPQ